LNYTIAVIEGDGIGPEIVGVALAVLETVGVLFGHTFVFKKLLAGGAAIDKMGIPLPEETIRVCQRSDSIILGAVGGPQWDNLPSDMRPERALLGIRRELGLYANIRPARLLPELRDSCPLRAQVAAAGFDMIIVRELTGGVYFGESGRRSGPDGIVAYDTESYSEREIERIGIIAFDLARSRSKRLISIDKANVLESSRLWREVMQRLAAKYSDVHLTNMLVDNAAMQLVRDPAQFDVIVTSNMFGDILSDEASQITGSIGMLPSASLGESRRGMYEPIHGSAPDIAGTNRANPIATVLSAALMLRLSLGLEREAACIEQAVSRVLAKGLRTADIATKDSAPISCSQMKDALLREL
jgi:3-isopropylmalate dehydrogenase